MQNDARLHSRRQERTSLASFTISLPPRGTMADCRPDDNTSSLRQVSSSFVFWIQLISTSGAPCSISAIARAIVGVSFACSCRIEQFGKFSQITAGGAPRRVTISAKSASFVMTAIVPNRRAASKSARSSASRSPISRSVLTMIPNRTPSHGGERGVQVRVQPVRQATPSVGCATRLAANSMQARTSSSSRSGSCATTRSVLKSAASSSSTSCTRIRIPRTQGLPPHWLGLNVMRDA